MVLYCINLSLWLLAGLAWWYLADRRLRRLRGAVVWRALLGAFEAVVVSYMAYFLFSATQSRTPLGGPLWWHTAGYIWNLLLMPLALASLAGLALLARLRRRGASRRASRSARLEALAPNLPPANRPSRRGVLGAAVVAAPPLIAAALTGRSLRQLHEFRVRRAELRLPGLPADLDGLTVAHLSDLHLGKFLPADMLKRLADATNALGADLVAFTGDLIDVGWLGAVPAGIEFLRSLDPGSGLAVIEGNHDTMAEASIFERTLRAERVPLLLNHGVTYRVRGRATPVQFLGITWGEWKRGEEFGYTGQGANKYFRVYSPEATATNVEAVARLRRPDAFPILLAHHPHAFDPAAAAGFPLTLSGHTHGGQLMLTENVGVGPSRFRYWTGPYRKGDAQLFVSNGLGNWFPIRLNAPTEIVHLTLRTA